MIHAILIGLGVIAGLVLLAVIAVVIAIATSNGNPFQ